MRLHMTFINLVFMLFGTLFAQIPDTIWSKIHDITEDVDIGQCVKQTADSGYIITGSCVPDGLTSHVDVLLLKTDASGNVEWTQTFDHNFFENGVSVDQTSDGGFIIGAIRLMGSYPFIEPPVSDAWIIKTDLNGDTVWTRSINMGGNEYCTSISQTTDFGFILTGAVNSESCGPTWEINELTSPDTGSTWLTKMDFNGNIVWTKSFFPKSNGNNVIQTSDGGFLITGCIFPDINSNQSDILLIKTDVNGDTLWTNAVGTANYDVGFCIRETSDGYLVSGQTKPVGQPYDALLIITDFGGDMIWYKIFGGQLSDAAFNLEVSSDGYYMAGATNGTWWVTNSADMWTFKTDLDGSLLWENIYDINTSDILYSGTLCFDEGYIVTGTTSYGFGGDIWLAKIGTEVSGVTIYDNQNRVSHYVLSQNYPNPFNPRTKIKYELHEPILVSVRVYNALGEMIVELVNEKKQSGNYEVEFDATEFPSGIYFCRLKTEKYCETRKMVLLK